MIPHLRVYLPSPSREGPSVKAAQTAGLLLFMASVYAAVFFAMEVM